MKRLIGFALLSSLLPAAPLAAQDDADATDAAEENGTLSGVVFLDADRNGERDESEAGSGGVVVEVLDEDGKFIARVITAEDGTYRFSGLEEGVYFLRFEFNAGYGVRSRGIELGAGGDTVFTPVPFLYPNSVYNFLRLNLTNPASFRGREVSSFKP